MIYDLVIIGGGINGAGIARDAAGRGLRVALVEQGDLAGATSSASSKLIHGGLRYLEQYAFRLVREALQERETLLEIAPHLIRPMVFVLPHDASQRPAWLIRAGLFLYDHLAHRKRLPASAQVDLRQNPVGAPLSARFSTGFTYADCQVDDARLVVLNALDARERGAHINLHCRVLDAEARGDLWHLRTTDGAGANKTLQARALVNAAGPWVERVLQGDAGNKHVRLVKGSHIVVPRLYPGDHAYILQNPDQRVIFLTPFQEDFTLIGTTDIPFEGDPASVGITPEEIRYLCAGASRFLEKPLHEQAVVWHYSGVRALYDDDSSASAQKVTRDYVLDLQGGGATPPLLTIYGGKITTYRRLAQQALDKLAPLLPAANAAWTGQSPLPGGDIPRGDMAHFMTQVAADYPFLDARTARRMARAYGTRISRVIGLARSRAEMGEDFGCGLRAREVEYLIREEFARNADDILWRRTKLGLMGGESLVNALNRYLEQRANTP